MDTPALLRRLRGRIIRYYERWRWGGLRILFKRLTILGIAGIVFVLGANYLLVYTLNQQVNRRRDPQDESYWSAYTAIVQVARHPDSASFPIQWFGPVASGELREQDPPPVFFVNVASTGFSLAVSLLSATLTRGIHKCCS